MELASSTIVSAADPFVVMSRMTALDSTMLVVPLRTSGSVLIQTCR